jgi:hypothetical protein
MQTLKYRRFGEHRWASVLIGLVICSLMLSLATRFCATAISQVSTVKSIQSRSVEPSRRHLDRDAIQWVPPVAHPVFLQRVEPSLRDVSAESLPPNQLFDESLYNRPPPPSAFIL